MDQDVVILGESAELVMDPLRAAVLRGEHLAGNIEVYEIIKNSIPYWTSYAKQAEESDGQAQQT